MGVLFGSVNAHVSCYVAQGLDYYFSVWGLVGSLFGVSDSSDAVESDYVFDFVFDYSVEVFEWDVVDEVG